MSNKPILSTQADLASSQTAGAPSPVMPTGVVLPYAGTSAPTGWLACDGTAISRTTYASLFAAISTSYGVGDGSTTFNLPDLRGRFPRFNDAMFGGSAAGRDSGRVLGSEQVDAVKSHAHTVATRRKNSVGASGAGYATPLATGNAGDNNDFYIAGAPGVDPSGFTPTRDDPGITIGPNSAATETRPINLAINAIIKV